MRSRDERRQVLLRVRNEAGVIPGRSAAFVSNAAPLLLIFGLLLAWLAGCQVAPPAQTPGAVETAVAATVAAENGRGPVGTGVTAQSPRAAVILGITPTPGLAPGATSSVQMQQKPRAEQTSTPAVTQPVTATQWVTGTLLAETPPGEPVVIGWTVEGRALEVYRFGDGAHKRMIVAGIHGGYEYNTVKLALELITHLKMYPWVVPEDVTLYILPDLNPDGYALQHGKYGRANAHGVDLNRNWDANWQADWSRSGCWDLVPITAGAYAHSEPEVQALAGFLLANPVEALISYHSAGLGIFPGGIPPTANSIALAQRLSAVSSYAYPPVATGCDYTGQFANWAAGTGIPAVDIELSTHGETDYDINLQVLDAFLGWRLP